MRGRKLLGIAALAFVGGAFLFFGYLRGAMEQPARSIKVDGGGRPTSAKPVCTSPVNPNVAAPTDCIPEHLAKLPHHPGKAALTAFIDTNNDGLRDEVEIAIEHKFGSSRRAVAAARQVAMAGQLMVAAGAMGISPEDAQVLASEKTMKAVDCFMRTVDPSLNNSTQLSELALLVTDTPERLKNKSKFQVAAASHIYPSNSHLTNTEVCGYDPAALPN